MKKFIMILLVILLLILTGIFIYIKTEVEAAAVKGHPFANKYLTVSFPMHCMNPDTYMDSKNRPKSPNYKIIANKTLEMPSQEIFGKWYSHSVCNKDDAIDTSYDLYDLKIIDYSEGKGVASILASGLSEYQNIVKSEFFIKHLLTNDDFKIKDFVVTNIKIVNKNSLSVYYFKIKLIFDSKDNYLVDAIVYNNISRKQLYVLAVYHEEHQGPYSTIEDDIKRFFNSFKVIC